MNIKLLMLTFLLLPLMTLRSEPATGELTKEFDLARGRYDLAKLAEIQTRLDAAANAAPDDYQLSVIAAECCLAQADYMRHERHICDVSKNDNGSIRSQQSELGEHGLPFAERALKSAKSNDQKATAERLLSELYAHQITGPITGTQFGGKALEHINRALELAPNDVESKRARGLMFLYNPPFKGGDVKKAIKIFSDCAKAQPDSDRIQTFLAFAYMKNKQKSQARIVAEKALKINPRNPFASQILKDTEPQLK